MPPARRVRTRGRAALVLLALAATLLAACGSSSPPQGDPATVVPAGAPVYVGATVRPGGQLGAQALDVARRLTGHQQPFASIEAMIAGLAGPQVSFTRDIQPWLGERAGAFFTSLAGGLSLRGASSSAGAAVIDVSDHGSAQTFLTHLASTSGAHPTSYRGVSYELTPGGVAFGFVGSFVVIGVQAAVRAVIDTHAGAPSLSTSAAYARARSQAPADTVAELHVGSSALLAALPASASVGSLLQITRAVLASSSIEAIDASLAVPSASSLVLSLGLTGGGAGPSSAPTAAQVFDSLPGDSWLALGTGALGPSLERLLAVLPPGSALGTSSLVEVLDLLRTLDGGGQHLLRWAGPTGVFAAGSGLLDLTAGVVITSSDDAAARAAVARIAAHLSAPGSTPTALSVPGTDAGLSVPLSGLPIAVDIVHAPGKVVIGLGSASVQAALHPTSTLGSSSIGQAAARTLGGGVAPSLLVDFPTLVSVIDGVNGLTGSPIFGTLPGFTSTLSDVVAGTVGSGADRTVRVVVNLQ
jgi:hypothetical protein